MVYVPGASAEVGLWDVGTCRDVAMLLLSEWPCEAQRSLCPQELSVGALSLPGNLKQMGSHRLCPYG